MVQRLGDAKSALTQAQLELPDPLAAELTASGFENLCNVLDCESLCWVKLGWKMRIS